MLNLKSVNTFVGRKQIIKGASLQIDNGNIIGLIGPNGAGKTTLMKTILGLMRFTGEIKVEGQMVTEGNHAALQDVGALIEHPAIYPFLSGFQNLKLYSRDEEDLKQVVSELQMNAYITEKSKNYSLGMKQKLGIAIAILNKPKLVILDEPMNGLDIEATILVRTIIKEHAAQGTSFLISSHVLGELQKVMTDVVLINDGKIIVDKPIDEFYHQSKQKMKLMTNNQEVVMALLSANKIPFTMNELHIIIDQATLYSVEDLLRDHDLHLLELSPMQSSLEDLIVDLLRQQQVLER